MDNPLLVRASSAPWWGGVELLVIQGMAVGVNIVMEQHNPAVVVDPTVRISNDAAQTLMDDLWRCGLRPTEGSGSAGAMLAVEKHCSDLRKIAFKTLDIHDA